MDKQTKAIRQIIMNEFGITKDTIRKEMAKIVEEQAEKVVNILLSDNAVENLVSNKVSMFLTNNKYNKELLADRINLEVKKQVTDIVMKSLSVNIGIKSNKEDLTCTQNVKF